MSYDTAPPGPARPSHAGAVVKRLSREYGWLIAAVGLGALVLLCSVPFVSGSGLTWNSADPLAAPVDVPRPAGSAPAFVPPPDAPPTSAAPTATATTPAPSPSVAATTRRPAVRTSGPTPPPPTTAAPSPAPPRAPVALGPDGGWLGLWQMLREYCDRQYRTREAQLRHGTGRAENNWECRREGADDPLIDMSAACKLRYGGVAFAQFSDRDDAFSWRCYRN
ncbi:hypothetical protein [Phytohabitans kaempferiae]|uniref:Uncharacterized protein n=1 Tax=Phytohabitans kaempferiae TaxID=1620943 RepID=A0ABV6MC77_9ACTN